jgi:hypothetical protein
MGNTRPRERGVVRAMYAGPSRTSRTLLLPSVEERELVEVDGLLAGSAVAVPTAQDGL